ncbi:hypothetical protein FF38_10539 [Lucilia cuprina]|uniref:Uncharacterized protein n=1 Tax=Lucilia cuprina TaxID=7375 RepID=A0A0L0BWR1_LUCCU|nr:hypothetical protein CVS40_4952 [Lucilia cuprina]KNC24451.1 hypothetical protein FF38_10539 [Lucilia cuprina]
MKLKDFIFTGFLFFTIVSNTTADKEKKKLKLVLDKLDKVKDAEHILKTDITFDKVGDDEVKINGQVEQSIDLDDEYKINMDVFHCSEKDGEFKKVIGVANVGVCQVMANQYKKYFYDTLKNHANAPDPDKCPVTQEIYVVKDYPLDSSKFQKFLKPGFYKTVVSLIHQEEEVLQYTFEGHTEEE